MGKISTFVQTTILAIAFSVSLGSHFAHAQDQLGDDGSVLDRSDYDSDYRLYQVAPSHWAIGFRATAVNFPWIFQGAFKSLSQVGDSYQLYGEWVLPFQKTGLFSLGGHYGVFPLNSSAQNASGNTIPYPNYLSQMGGLQFRYQLRYARNQFFVPTVALEADYYRLLIGNGSVDHVSGILIGGDVGFMLSMGFLDEGTARDAYQTLSMTRTYLTFELHPIQITGDTFSFKGNFLYLGMRFEFE